MIYNIPTDHQQAAIEAAANSLRQIEPNLYQNPYNPQQYYGGLAQDAIAAAEPHLRRKWAAEARKLLNLRADFQGPHATARNRGIHDVISLLEGAGE